MQKVLSAQQMREVDRLTTEKYGIPSILLMENAAYAAARVITEKLGGNVAGKSFLILCGKGNNGGDGAALARILEIQDAYVTVVLFGKFEGTKDDARINFQIWKKYEEFFYEFESYEDWDKWYWKTGFEWDVVVDTVFGTGLNRPIDLWLGKIIHHINIINESPRPPRLCVSLDLPSGVSADLAEAIGETFQANLTVTFTAPKLANVFPPASNFNGELVVANIGSPQELIDNSPSRLFLAEKADAQKWLEQTKFTTASYKNKRGHALLIVGSRQYSGAAVLAGNAAIVSGVGLVTIATSESAQDSIASRVLPEVMIRGAAETESGAISEDAFDALHEFIEKSIDAVAIGSGLSSSDESTKRLVRKLVEERRTPVVIDADGLNALSPFDLRGNDEFPLILTPHEGEFLRLLGTTDKDALKERVSAVRDFAEKHNIILVLKGERTLIGAPDGRVCINPTGNSGLGKAGNGDTLTGIITGFVAQAVQSKADIFETVVAAVYIAGLAGDIAAAKHGKRTMLASDVRECLGAAFQSITN